MMYFGYSICWIASWLFLSHAVQAAKNLCDDTRQVKVHEVPASGKDGTSIISSTPNASAGASEEWIMEGSSNDFITVEFTKFNLLGPVCSDNVTGYSTIRIETSLNGVTNPYYLFCKGRRSPVGEPISSMGSIRVAYCHHFASAEVQFKVSTGCSGVLLARGTNTVFKVHKRKSSCWIHLKSLGTAGIKVDFSEIFSTAKKKKCLGSFISVKEMLNSVQRSLLPDGLERMCNASGIEPLKDNYTFTTRSQGINITYKKATFRLSYREFLQDELIVRRIWPDEEATTASINGSALMTSISYESSANGTTQLIIALGCGGLLVILVIIATLVFLKRRSTKSYTRKESVKRQTVSSGAAEDAALVREHNVGCINNAMYGQVVSGDGALDMTRERKKRERLSQLEEKYGPFPETSLSLRVPHNTGNSKIQTRGKHPIPTLMHESEMNLLRKGTRPEMPLPRTANASTTSNLYETIDEVQQERVASSENIESRLSYFSMTSDEFSEDDQSPLPTISYDPVPQETNYATTLNGSSTSYDNVEEDEEQRLHIPVAEYIAGPVPENLKEVKYRRKKKKHLTKVDGVATLTPAMAADETSKSAPMLSSKDTHYQTPNRAAKHLLHPEKSRTASHGVIAHLHKSSRSADRFAPRPSLPEINQCQGQTSSVNSLQQDAENYLRPRPSCPDAMIACAYSSSEDLSEMRRRLLAAAHPSLLNGNSGGTGVSESDVGGNANYDSPRPSAANELAIPPAAQYASPRQRNKKSKPST